VYIGVLILMLPITYCGTHTGRRTFICNALALDIPPHQCRQCADAVPLLKDRQLYIVPPEPTRLGRQGY